MGKLNFFLLLMILVNISFAEITEDSLTTTSAPEELYEEDVTVTEIVHEVNKIESTICDDGESQTTEAAVELESTTEQEITDANTERNNNEVTVEIDTTTNSEVESETTTSEPPTVPSTAQPAAPPTTPPAPVCTTSGVLADENNCQLYYECSSEGSADGSLQAISKSCPEKLAFSTKLNRCSRDISSCSLDIQCAAEGNLPDPNSNSSYYHCQQYYGGGGFHIFHISCAYYEIYHPLLRKCFWDLQTPLPLLPVVKDVDIVKAELKLIKEEHKAELKKAKEQKKAEEKLKKQQEKEAKKQAKAEEKLQKENAKLEAAGFVCAEEGNFASQVANNLYIACINKKDKLKAVSMKCISGATFEPISGVCSNVADTIEGSSNSNESDD